MALDLRDSAERLRDWTEKNSTTYGDPKSQSEGQSVIDDWETTIEQKKGKKSSAQIEQVKDILRGKIAPEIEEDIKARNLKYKEETRTRIKEIKTLEELTEVDIDTDYESTTQSVLTRQKSIRDRDISWREETLALPKEEIMAKNIGQLETLGFDNREAWSLKTTGEL